MRIVQLGDVSASELGDLLRADRRQDDVVEQPTVVAGGARLALGVDVLCEPLLGDGAHRRRLVGGPALVAAFLRRVSAARHLAQNALGLTAGLLRRPRRSVLADGAAADRRLAAFAGAVAGDIGLDAGRPYS